jgi:hypothetical protein
MKKGGNDSEYLDRRYAIQNPTFFQAAVGKIQKSTTGYELWGGFQDGEAQHLWKKVFLRNSDADTQLGYADFGG